MDWLERNWQTYERKIPQNGRNRQSRCRRFRILWPFLIYGLVNMICGEEFQNETERVWQELKPLYDSLQCHVKNKLTEYYGPEIMPGDGTIPAHILGNMWANHG